MQILGAAGNGTGENLSDYYMEHFSLTPGRGGEEYEVAPYQIVGGGGGGVLVNGEGPTRPCAQTRPHWPGGEGEGYGGGATDCTGLPGVILIEVGP